MGRTVNIDIPNLVDGVNEAFLPLIRGDEVTRKPLLLSEGGRGSGKSVSVAEALTLEALREKQRIAIVRKVFDTIRDSTHKEIKDNVERWGLEREFAFLYNPLSVRVRNGTEFICKGLDKSEKIKSLANVDLLVVEEATELTKEDWETLSFTVRGKTRKGKPKRIWLIWNRQLGHWTEGYFNADGTFREQEHIYHLHTTFEDNKFLSDYDRQKFEELRQQDPELYKKIALGLPVQLQGLIYTNWDIVETFPEGLPIDMYGLDFGTTDPMVLTRVGVREKECWLDERLYRTGMHTGQLIELLPSLLHRPDAEIYADSEDANSIKQLQDAGFNVIPAIKGKDSVYAGIMFCKGFKQHVTSRSVHGRKDMENYKWKDKPPDVPEHFASHFPDSFRYPLFTALNVPMPSLSFIDLEEPEPEWRGN